MQICVLQKDLHKGNSELNRDDALDGRVVESNDLKGKGSRKGRRNRERNKEEGRRPEGEGKKVEGSTGKTMHDKNL